MSATMQGRRVEWHEQLMAPGEYSKTPDGTWYAETPNGHGANLSEHQVTEHEDGTITISPSILVSVREWIRRPTGPADPGEFRKVELWHGYLERGVWRSC